MFRENKVESKDGLCDCDSIRFCFLIHFVKIHEYWWNFFCIVWRLNLVPKTQNSQKSNNEFVLKVKIKAKKNAKKQATKRKKYCLNRCNKSIKNYLCKCNWMREPHNLMFLDVNWIRLKSICGTLPPFLFFLFTFSSVFKHRFH